MSDLVERVLEDAALFELSKGGLVFSYAQAEMAVRAALVAAEDEIGRKDDALQSIRDHCAAMPSAMARAIVATCDSALQPPQETE